MDNSLYNCDLCQEILTPPVRIVKSVGNICNDCFNAKFDENRSWIVIENTRLEALLIEMRFSCKFQKNGCKEKILFKNLKTHQDSCSFKSIKCCFLECSWNGIIGEFIQHACQQHNEHIKRSSDKNVLFLSVKPIKFKQSFTKVLIFKNGVLVLQFNIKGNMLSHSIFNVLVSGNFKLSVKYVARTTELKVNCKILPFGTVLEDSSAINLDVFKQEEYFTMAIEIKSETGSCNPKVLQHLECPVCKDFMFPPISMCLTGHSFCSNCKPKLNSCPTCRGSLGNSRNYSLENLASEVRYPCMYGCGDSFGMDEITVHELACFSKIFYCPICSFDGNFENFRKHCENEHVVRIIDGDYYETNFDLNFGENRIIRESFQFFFDAIGRNICVLIVSIIRGQYVWVVKVCTKVAKQKYFYEIGVTDPERNRKLSRSEPCFTLDTDLKFESDCRISFSAASLEMYEGANGLMIYYCKILKKDS